MVQKLDKPDKKTNFKRKFYPQAKLSIFSVDIFVNFLFKRLHLLHLKQNTKITAR